MDSKGDGIKADGVLIKAGLQFGYNTFPDIVETVCGDHNLTVNAD